MADNQSDMDQVWAEVLGRLQRQMGQQTFDLWLLRSYVFELKAGVRMIAVKNGVAKAWVENRFYNLILRALKACIKPKIPPDRPNTDGIHTDVPHSDVPHSDVPHSDVNHLDVPHSDVPHSDVNHSDVNHSDVNHSELAREAVKGLEFVLTPLQKSSLTPLISQLMR